MAAGDKARFLRRARLIRSATGGGGLESAMRKAAKALADRSIPHLIAGGAALQERGYPRMTADVDIVVPDVRAARRALLESGFEPSAEAPNSVFDPASEFEIDLLPGGKRILPHQILPFPMPKAVSAEPRIASLKALIEMKLSAGRGQDLVDVRKLIDANSLPQRYRVAPALQARYDKEWEMASVERAAEGLLGEY